MASLSDFYGRITPIRPDESGGIRPISPLQNPDDFRIPPGPGKTRAPVPLQNPYDAIIPPDPTKLRTTSVPFQNPNDFATPPQIPKFGGVGGSPALNAAYTGATQPAPGQISSALPGTGFAPVNVVQDTLTALTDPNSAYMRNAALRGRELAAQRGGINSAIAAGSSQRAALEAAQPFVSEALSLQRQRESQAFQENFAQNEAYRKDWLSSSQFNREFAGGLSLLPIQNSFQMLQSLFEYGVTDPAVYTPEVMSGLSNFFNQNMQDIIGRYFGGVGSLVGGG